MIKIICMKAFDLGADYRMVIKRNCSYSLDCIQETIIYFQNQEVSKVVIKVIND